MLNEKSWSLYLKCFAGKSIYVTDSYYQDDNFQNKKFEMQTRCTRGRNKTPLLLFRVNLQSFSAVPIIEYAVKHLLLFLEEPRNKKEYTNSTFVSNCDACSNCITFVELHFSLSIYF